MKITTTIREYLEAGGDPNREITLVVEDHEPIPLRILTQKREKLNNLLNSLPIFHLDPYGEFRAVKENSNGSFTEITFDGIYQCAIRYLSNISKGARQKIVLRYRHYRESIYILRAVEYDYDNVVEFIKTFNKTHNPKRRNVLLGRKIYDSLVLISEDMLDEYEHMNNELVAIM